MKITRLFGQPDEHALDVLRNNFDIADIGPGESAASIAYTQSRIDVARENIKKITDPKEYRAYDDWLAFFQMKIDEASSAAPDSYSPSRSRLDY